MADFKSFLSHKGLNGLLSQQVIGAEWRFGGCSLCIGEVDSKRIVTFSDWLNSQVLVWSVHRDGEVFTSTYISGSLSEKPVCSADQIHWMLEQPDEMIGDTGLLRKLVQQVWEKQSTCPCIYDMWMGASRHLQLVLIPTDRSIEVTLNLIQSVQGMHGGSASCQFLIRENSSGDFEVVLSSKNVSDTLGLTVCEQKELACRLVNSSF